MRVTDVVPGVPQLILALALAQLMSPSLESAMLALTLTYWPFFTRIVYAETRRAHRRCSSTRCAASAPAARASSSCTSCPTALSPVIVRATIGWASPSWSRPCWASSAWAPRRPTPDWGLAIAESRTYLPRAWWFATFPGLAILITVMGFNLLGDGLRDIVDPRLRRSR